jgi:hypothetical protein
MRLGDFQEAAIDEFIVVEAFHALISPSSALRAPLPLKNGEKEK